MYLIVEISLSLSENVDKLTKDDVNRMALLVANLDKAQEVLGPQWYKNPEYNYTGYILDAGISVRYHL